MLSFITSKKPEKAERKAEGAACIERKLAKADCVGRCRIVEFRGGNIACVVLSKARFTDVRLLCSVERMIVEEVAKETGVRVERIFWSFSAGPRRAEERARGQHKEDEAPFLNSKPIRLDGGDGSVFSDSVWNAVFQTNHGIQVADVSDEELNDMEAEIRASLDASMRRKVRHP